MTPQQKKQQHDQMVKALVDKGCLVEAAFLGFRLTVIPVDASPTQVSEMRMAFMCGAQHLYSSLMSMFDHGPSDEPTDADMRRMQAIHLEMDKIGDEFKSKAGLK